MVFLGIANWLTFGVESLGPVHRAGELARDQTFAGTSIDGEVVAVAAGGHDQLAGVAGERGIGEDGRWRGGASVRGMRRGLEVPRHLPRVHVQSNDGARVKVVEAFTAWLRHVGRRGVAG